MLRPSFVCIEALHKIVASRASDHIFRDEGSFRGVLSGTRAIGMYPSAEVDAWSPVSSAKTALFWNEAEDVDEIWLNGLRIKRLPADLPEGQVRIEELEAGTVVWDKGQVTIDAIGLRGAGNYRRDRGKSHPPRLGRGDR